MQTYALSYEMIPSWPLTKAQNPLHIVEEPNSLLVPIRLLVSFEQTFFLSAVLLETSWNICLVVTFSTSHSHIHVDQWAIYWKLCTLAMCKYSKKFNRMLPQLNVHFWFECKYSDFNLWHWISGCFKSVDCIQIYCRKSFKWFNWFFFF